MAPVGIFPELDWMLLKVVSGALLENDVRWLIHHP
jgi:hypothetical protein